jgi:hypothetical protein
VVIVSFRKPDYKGSPDHIIQVSNLESVGWVKPSNISKDSPSSMNPRPSREELSFGGSSIFGYDKIVRRGFGVTLEGRDVLTLEQGMIVELEGDSKGYVPGGFRPGEKVVIVTFRQPFDEGSSDHIIQVSNLEGVGWVKPSNIAGKKLPS